jgi:hypothetical protein
VALSCITAATSAVASAAPGESIRSLDNARSISTSLSDADIDLVTWSITKGRAMHSAVRTYRVTDVDALVTKVEGEFVSQVKEIDGFVGYYLVDGGDGTVVSITVGDTAEAVQASTKAAGEWVRQSVPELIEGPPQVVAGEVRVRAER